MPKPFLTAHWKNLLMANYEIDPAVLQPYLPRGTELDTFHGVHFVSLVGFLFDETKVLGVGFPFHQTFEEVNLRFYVRYKVQGTWKRGVVFLKEIVPKHIISFIANTLYGESYATHKMSHNWRFTGNSLEVDYRWKVGAEWNYMKAVADAQKTAIVRGSAEEFITEHYWGYTFINDGCSGTYEVRHRQWNIHAVTSFAVQCSAETLYGPGFAMALAEHPRSVFLADGSPVSVLKGSKIMVATAV